MLHSFLLVCATSQSNCFHLLHWFFWCLLPYLQVIWFDCYFLIFLKSLVLFLFSFYGTWGFFTLMHSIHTHTLSCSYLFPCLSPPPLTYAPYIVIPWTFRMVLLGKWIQLPAMQETRVQALDQEHPLQEGMATHSSTLPWRIPWTEEPRQLSSMELKRVGHNWSDWHACIHNYYIV